MVSKKKLIRHNQIVEMVDEKGYVSIDELYEKFGVSKVSIRRDLTDLEQEGRLIRKFGGAASLNELKVMGADGTLVKRGQQISIYSPEYLEDNCKRQIALAATSLIKNGARLILDAGSTISEIIPYLEQKERLLIMTNSLKIANNLLELPLLSRPKLMVTGGAYDQASDTFQGVINREVLKSYSFDQLFIGADGLDFEKGTMSINEGDSYSKEMAEISQEVIVVIESSKLGRKMPKVELPWSAISTVITDNQITEENLAALEATGVNVIVASDTYPKTNKGK